MKVVERELQIRDRFAIADFLLEELAGRHKSVLDLGAGHCRFSISSAKHGMNVTAMDARTVRVPKNLPENVHFVRGNFMSGKPAGNFDLVLMLGIFYHISLEEQRKLLEMYRGVEILLDTHCCSEAGADVCEGDARGWYYKEGADEKSMLANPGASFTVLRSFWHTEASLINLLSGYFSLVEKIRPDHYPLRTFYICKP